MTNFIKTSFKSTIFLLVLFLVGVSCKKDEKINVQPEIADISSDNSDFVLPSELITVHGQGFSETTIFLINDIEIPVVELETSSRVKIRLPENVSTGYLKIKGQDSEYGYPLKVKDEGWNEAEGLQNARVEGMMFVPGNRQIGYLFGRDLFKTTNGGLNWSKVNSSALDGNPIKDVYVASENVLYLHSEILSVRFSKSIDGGATWDLLPFPEQNFEVVDFSFKNENEGYVIVDVWSENEWLYKVYHTIDGGESWVRIPGIPETPVSNSRFSRSGNFNWLVSEYFQKAYELKSDTSYAVNLPRLIREDAPVIFTENVSFAAGYPGIYSVKSPLAGMDDYVSSDPCVIWKSEDKGVSWDKVVEISDLHIISNLIVMDYFDNTVVGVNSYRQIVIYDNNTGDYIFRKIDVPEFLYNNVKDIHISGNEDFILFTGGRVYVRQNN